MIILIFEISCILSGILLGINLLSNQKSIGESVTSLSKNLTGYQFTLGSLALILGTFLLIFRQGGVLLDVVGMVAGITLLGSKLNDVPVIGNVLSDGSNWLNTYRDYIGIAAIVMGILGLLNVV